MSHRIGQIIRKLQKPKNRRAVEIYLPKEFAEELYGCDYVLVRYYKKKGVIVIPDTGEERETTLYVMEIAPIEVKEVVV